MVVGSGNVCEKIPTVVFTGLDHRKIILRSSNAENPVLKLLEAILEISRKITKGTEKEVYHRIINKKNTWTITCSSFQIANHVQPFVGLLNDTFYMTVPS